ncbi:MAG: hypothetical protein C5B60_06150 [Chloroflexi bacterium]|nr:MAG: hypothetical protein C5B60_06150 [Chloroflexota bacterium]
MNNGSVGMVGAYNFGIDSNYFLTMGTMMPMATMNHENSWYTLVESNNIPGLNTDQVHGSGGMGTAFRNRVRGNDWPRRYYGLNGNADIQAFNRFTNYVSNIVADPDVATVYQGSARPTGNAAFQIGLNRAMGNSYPTRDLLTFQSLLRWGNYDAVSNFTHWCGDASSPNWATACNGVVSAQVVTIPNALSGNLGAICSVQFNVNGGGNGAAGWVALTATNTIAPGTAIIVESPGWNYVAPGPTQALLTGTGCGNQAITVSSTLGTVSEIPTSPLPYMNGNSVPANTNLPPSFYLSTQPSFWQMKAPLQTPPWPAIGPDVNASGSLDTTCTASTVASGPGSPAACDGIGHHAYQIPAQICFNSRPVDPDYERTFRIRDGRWIAGGNVIGGMELTVTNTLRRGDIVVVKDVIPDTYNGVYQLEAASARTIRYYKFGNPNAGAYVSGGTVTSPGVREFDARECYANE